MKRKMIALFLIFAMLASLSPAVAADEVSATLTVEEILNEYHRKAFEAKTQGDTETASAWSCRSGSTKTLEQETVDTLTEAGYEAYNVTADNYDTLEAELNTDFAAMGLDPEGSYIMVISGEEEETASTGGQSTYNISSLPEEDQAPEDGGSATCFSYTYNNTTYWMRYVTVTSATDYDPNPDLRSSSSYILKYQDFSEHWSEIGEAVVSFGVDQLTKVPLATIAALIGEIATDSNHIIMEDDDIILISTSIWTHDVIEIWNPESKEWDPAQRSSYARSGVYATGYIYDEETHTATPYVGEEITGITYSPMYHNATQRKECAVNAFLGLAGTDIWYDRTGDIYFYLNDSTGTVNLNGKGVALFSNPDWT